MSRTLDQMTKEELGLLFPVTLTGYDENWRSLFSGEKSRIEEVFRGTAIAIVHVGSTAIPGMKAKPSIDIVVEILPGSYPAPVIEKFAGLGYHYIRRPDSPAPHMMFVKGYTEKGFEGQAFHVHIRYPGDRDEIVFRDYLLRDPATATEYSELKIRLAGQFPNDREAYTAGKTEFVKKVLEKSRLVTTMPFVVASANADMFRRLRAGALADILIQAAIRSADTLQAGFGELREQKLIWVLSRMTLEINRPLSWYESGEAETWPKNVEKIFYLRDFIVRGPGEEVIAKATSGWLAIDIDSRRIRALSGDASDIFSKMKNRHAISAMPEKLSRVTKGETSEVKAAWFDIDLNGHVTSSRYIDWMMDTFSVEFHRDHYPKILSINYLNEILIGETIRLTRSAAGENTFLFEGFNTTRDIPAFLGKIQFNI